MAPTTKMSTATAEPVRHIGPDDLAHVARWPDEWTEGALFARCDHTLALDPMVAPAAQRTCRLCDDMAPAVVVVDCDGRA